MTRREDEDDRLLRLLRDFPLAGDVPASFGEIDAEDEEAEALCDALLAGPSSRWRERVSAMPHARTAGMVRALLRRMPALVERRPADALHLTSVAIAVADVLDPRAYWTDHVIVLRGQARRDHAYVLSFHGRYAEALVYVERAERELAQAPGEDLDLARLALVKALALRMQNRSEEAIALTRQAAATFLELDDRRRYLNARITEAAMLYDGGAVERALEVWASVRHDRDLDETDALRAAHNIAACLCDLGRHAEAVAPLEHCVSGFARLGLHTERTRSRWYLANALLGTDRRRESVTLLLAVRHELTELGLTVDAALAALDLAEALLANGKPSHVPSLCRHALAQLTEAGLPQQALPALTLLREAAAAGGVSRELLRNTQATVRRAGNVRQWQIA